MLRNRFPLNAEHEKSKIPMGELIRKRAKNLFMVLIALLTTHILIIWAVEELTLFESLWMTMTTIATVGYGDYAPVTYIGRISTILFIFVGAIILMTLIVSDFIEYRFYRRERILTGRWIYKMNNHIVIINTPKHGGVTYFMRFAKQIRSVQGYETIPIMLLTREFPSGLPAELSDLGIVHFHGRSEERRVG